jgi:Mn2+/Fe2+ NRAMP family transporter
VLHISPLKALIWSAALNAIIAAPIMALVMRLGASAKVMGQFRIHGAWWVLGWCATGVMGAASVTYLVSLLLGR